MLSLTTKSRYAARMLVFLAGRAEAARQEIAAAEDLSPSYVEQILLQLKTAGLVKSMRGAKGGFALARDPAEITVAEVVRIMEGATALVPCQSGACARAGECVTRPVWRKVADAIDQVLATVSIAELADQAARVRPRRKATGGARKTSGKKSKRRPRKG